MSMRKHKRRHYRAHGWLTWRWQLCGTGWGRIGGVSGRVPWQMSRRVFRRGPVVTLC